MKIAVLAETRVSERRVACLPATVPLLANAGFEVIVASGAGRSAYADDAAYEQAGARIAENDPVSQADVVVSVQPLEADRARQLAEGALAISFLSPPSELDTIRVFVERRITSFSFELLPRVTRAQSIDALSSQALISGYRAVLLAAERLPRFLPMFTTAAGTIPPARVLVLGAGVAGLQAIATARRLGAVVEAYDVRAAAAEEVQSLGATFLQFELEAQEGAGGYAGEQAEDFLTRQRELIGRRIAEADAVITTAAIPGKPAPRLVSSEMVRAMKRGSVLIDLAAESGGNCELSVPGEEFRHGDALVFGARNLPSGMPVHASQLYARNVANLLLLMASEGQVSPDLNDEVLAGCCLTHNGVVRHEPTRQLLVEGTS